MPGAPLVLRGTRERALYRDWVLANAWAELAGLGTAFLLGFAAAPSLAARSTLLEALLSAVVAILLGTFLEGVVVGCAQGRVLGAYLPALRARDWLVATAIGAGTAWTFGMLPSTVLALGQAAIPTQSPPPAVLEGPLQHLLAAGLGAVLGPFLGVPQWFVLRRHVARAGRWVTANVVAWAAGMPLVFIGLGSLGEHPSGLRLVLTVVATCSTTGLLVGAVHGRWLCALTR